LRHSGAAGSAPFFSCHIWPAGSFRLPSFIKTKDRWAYFKRLNPSFAIVMVSNHLGQFGHLDPSAIQIDSYAGVDKF
jgi:hypothetical protein